MIEKKLASYASNPKESRGREYKDFFLEIRTPFQRDRDRIIHCQSFRKLNGKTQVFAYYEGKNYRTRLTHSLEVSQIARTIARDLMLDEDLAEALSLAHDLGHTPFGHAGERALKGAMEEYGGFDHNANTLKVLTQIEDHYSEFPGLNLSWEVLEGTVKHNGPLIGKNANSGKSVDKFILEYDEKYNLALGEYSSLESQIASISDDIAYNNHDLDDGFRAGYYTMEDIRQIDFMDKIICELEAKGGYVDDNVRIYAITRKLITEMILDVIENTKNNIKNYNIVTSDDARKAGFAIVSFSNKMLEKLNVIRKFLKDNFYTNHQVVRMDMKSQKLIEELFFVFMNNYKLLPKNLSKKITANTKLSEQATVICEYISSMTDAFALEEHDKLYNLNHKF